MNKNRPEKKTQSQNPDSLRTEAGQAAKRLDLAGKHGRKTMIRKKWNGDELVLSVETEDEFWKALTTGEAVELTRELGDQIGLMEDKTITEAEVEAARNDPND